MVWGTPKYWEIPYMSIQDSLPTTQLGGYLAQWSCRSILVYCEGSKQVSDTFLTNIKGLTVGDCVASPLSLRKKTQLFAGLGP